VTLMVWAVEVLAIPTCWEENRLSDHLALRIAWNLNSIAASARRTANEGVVVRGGPATMTDGS